MKSLFLVQPLHTSKDTLMQLEISGIHYVLYTRLHVIDMSASVIETYSYYVALCNPLKTKINVVYV